MKSKKITLSPTILRHGNVVGNAQLAHFGVRLTGELIDGTPETAAAAIFETRTVLAVPAVLDTEGRRGIILATDYDGGPATGNGYSILDRHEAAKLRDALSAFL